MAKKAKTFKPVEQTQDDVAIKDVCGGIVINNKNKFVKIMEIKPIPFEFKRQSEQNKITNTFKSLLKVAPDELHFKSVALKADLTEQINNTIENLNSETKESCRKMGEETLKNLQYAEKNGTQRRFFISFPYGRKTTGLNSKTFPEILYNIESDASVIENVLNSCGNEVVHSSNNNPNYDIVKLFYTLFNRDCYLDETFEQRVQETWQRYYDATGDEDSYIWPPDLIAPRRISYNDPNYLLVNDTYYSFLYIPSYGYKKSIYTGWLDFVIPQIEGVDVDIFLKKTPREQVINAVKRSIGHSRASIGEAQSDISDSFESNSSTLQSAMYIKDGLNAGEDFYNMATIITVCGNSPAEVDEKIDTIKRSASANDVVLHQNKYRLEETFNAVLPSSMWNDDIYTFKKTRRNILSDGAASMYLFTSYQICDPKGLYIANDFKNSPVIIDFFNRKRLVNGHLFMAGESGSGKSTSGMITALRFLTAHSKDNGFVIIIAPEKENEFYRVCDAVGGQRISFGAGSPDRLNIMDITPRSKESLMSREIIDGTDEFSSTSYLAEKIATLMEFFQMHVTDITIEEKQLLNEALIRTYERKGITQNNQSLWADKEETKYKKMPIISDLVAELEKEKDSIRLSRAIKLLTNGAGEHFNGETNVDISNRFVVIGLEHNSRDMLAKSIYAAMEFAWNKIKSDYRPCMLWIDEWWKLASEQSGFGMEKSMQMIRLGRSMNCSILISTQDTEEVVSYGGGAIGKTILNNCATKIFLSMKQQSALAVQELCGLSDREIAPLARFKPGEALMVNSQATLAIRFTPTETEQMLIFTDQATREKYIQMKQNKSSASNEVEDENITIMDKNDDEYIDFSDLEEEDNDK